MDPNQIKKLQTIFNRHRGASLAIARELNVQRATVSQWFRGRIQSKRIATAIQSRAVELLDKERAELSSPQQ